MGGVPGDWEKEENCPKTSHLTLTRITKGPKNRGSETEEEVAREEEEPAEIQHPQFKSEALELEQRQRSKSPVLTFSLEVRQVH